MALLRASLVEEVAPTVSPDSRPIISDAQAAGPLIKEILSSYRGRSAESDALSQCLGLVRGIGPPGVLKDLARLNPAWRDHAIASVYAVLMPRALRKALGAYFTPPHLVNHLVQRLEALGLDISHQRLRDPAAGGAAFLVPLARRKVEIWRLEGLTDQEIATNLAGQLYGCEINSDLAKLANALLRQMLVDEFHLADSLAKGLEIVATCDGLETTDEGALADLEIGNPPYLRLSRANQKERQAEFSDIASGRLNLYAMFLRRALDHVKPQGLVGYVIPASFLGGPEFTTFRSRVSQLAQVKVIDLIEKRSDVFLDATQDACFIVLQRRPTPLAKTERTNAASGLLQADGTFLALGDAAIEPEGGPWRLPGREPANSGTLSEWGFRGMVGYLVANRQSERLHAQSGSDRFPLIWAKSISTEGLFDFERGMKHKGRGWVEAPTSAPYIVRTECVAVQRTSSRGQKRRLAAALVPRAFVEAHGGVVAENHVILLVPTRPDSGSAQALADALNRTETSEQLNRVCGSASISVRLLEQLKFSPKPPSSS